jgi:cell division protein FtsB
MEQNPVNQVNQVNPINPVNPTVIQKDQKDVEIQRLTEENKALKAQIANYETQLKLLTDNAQKNKEYYSSILKKSMGRHGVL